MRRLSLGEYARWPLPLPKGGRGQFYLRCASQTSRSRWTSHPAGGSQSLSPGACDGARLGPNDVPEPVAHGRSLSLLPAPGKDLMAFRNKDTLRQLLQRWFEHYDVVIFDTSS